MTPPDAATAAGPAEPTTIIQPDGTANGGDPNLPADECKILYRAMVAQRMLEDRGTKLQRQGRIGFYIGGLGQEATGAGAALALRPDDWILPSYRSPAFVIVRGVELKKLVHQCYGNARDGAKGRQMPNHYSFKEANFVSISSPLATQIPHATGVAMAMKLRGDGNVALCDFGDGATSEGDFHVGLNFAAVFKAPAIFLCQNNGWAISVPVERQTASASFAIKAKAYGMPGVRVDGNDALAVYAAVRDAADRARAGGGPTLIEAVTFRMGSHSSSDDWTKYRDKAEVEAWAKKDPIDRFRRYMEKRGDWDAALEQGLRDKIAAEIEAGVKEAESTPEPPLVSMFEDVLAELPYHLRRQQAELVAEQDETKTDRDASMAFPL
jgi:pyruvate dehydrogenase E1 component alpha subunit